VPAQQLTVLSEHSPDCDQDGAQLGPHAV
jgi:hypothetical protein